MREPLGAAIYNREVMGSPAVAEEWVHTLFNKISRAYNAHDAAATADCYAEDLLFTVNGERGPRDRDAFVEALREQWLGFPDIACSESSRLIRGNRVVMEFTLDGHNAGPFLDRPPTGKRWCVTLSWICEVADGRVREVHAYVDNEPLRRAVDRAALTPSASPSQLPPASRSCRLHLLLL